MNLVSKNAPEVNDFREELLSQTQSYLQEVDYEVSRIENSAALDLIAEPPNDFINLSTGLNSQIRIFLKVLGNLDSYKDRHSLEMRLHCHLLNGAPLLISNKYSKGQELHDDIVYFRHSIACINLLTLRHLLQKNINLTQIATRGNSDPLISIDGKKLSTYLKNTGRNQIEVSKELDISRQSLISYQKEITKPSLTTYNQLIDFIRKFSMDIHSAEDIDHNLRKPIDILDYQNNEFFNDFSLFPPKNNSLQQELHDHIEEVLQLKSFWFKSFPWDGLIADESFSPIFTGASKSNSELQQFRMELSSKILNFLQQRALWIVDNDSSADVSIHDPHFSVISTHDFFNIKESEKLRSMLITNQKGVQKE